MNFNEHIKKELINEYTGSEKKKTVILDDGCKYLLKFPDPIRESKNDISYINNAISEYIGCKIVKSLGLPVQEVIIGEYIDERGKKKIACACKDVRRPGEIMHQIQTINLSSLDDTTRNEASLKNAMDFAKRFRQIPEEEIKSFYYDMFVADALLGNTDRHNGNWAILTDFEGNARISPIYDCGSSLSPLLAEDYLDYRHLSSDALNTFSAILDNNNKRINYKDYLLSCENLDLNEAVKRVVGRIDLDVINKIIDDIPYISERRKQFYKDLMTIRYEKILVPTLQKLFQRNQDIVNYYTKSMTPNDLKEVSNNELEQIRKLDDHKMHTISYVNTEETIMVRKVNNKLAILYNQDEKVTGVAPIRKDYQEVKSFIFERDYACGLLNIEKSVKGQIGDEDYKSKDDHDSDITIDDEEIDR